MALTRDRFIHLRELAERFGKAPKTLRKIAEQQHGIAMRTLTNRTLAKWPKFRKDGSGRWGLWQSQVESQESSR